MRLLFSILAFLALANVVTAQKKLKTMLIKETGDTLYSTSEERIYVKPGSKNSVADYLKTTVHKSSGTMRLEFSIQTGRTSVFSISDGSTATLTLKDGSEVNLSASGHHSSKVSRLDYGCWMFAFYKLPSSAISKLKSSGVKSITIQASIGPMDYEIKDKFADTIMDQINKF